MAASTASKLGLRVLMVDRRDEASVGDKVCGDALGSHYLGSLGLSLPSECFHGTSPGIEVHSPDLRSVFRVEEKSLRSISLNRHAFGQFLLKGALSAGAEFVDRFHVSSPVLEGGAVVGVRGLGRDGAKCHKAKVVADCSGIASVVRRGVPDEAISRRYPREDIMTCYREIRRLKRKLLEYLQIYLDQIKIPGGYAWVFPLGGELVNVGLGIQMTRDCTSPRGLFHRYVTSMEQLEGSTLINGGGGLVPTSRPMDSMVFNGIMVAGDAACAVSPLHGGGIGSSMLSGRLLAEACAEALSRGSVKARDLWNYNRRYMAAYGAKQASLNVFRRFLQSSTNEELNFGMAHKVVAPDDILAASQLGELRLSMTEKAVRAFRGVGRPDFLLRLRGVAQRMKEIKALYLAYPDPEGYDDWLAEVRALESLA
jgi:flavin-dependent dehydrogenase